MKLSYDKLKGLMKNKLMQAGLEADHVNMTADVLTWSDERSYHSHGAMHVEYYSERVAKGGITVDPRFGWKETGLCSAVLEGDDGCGYVASVLTMEEAIEMAERSGIAAIGIRNISRSGSIGYYTEMAAKTDLVAITCYQSDPMAVLYSGIEPYYGTNPISFTAPTADERAVVFDMAAAAQTWDEVLDKRSRHESIPDTWTVDAKGRPTTDSRLVNALVPIEGAKGYGLMMMVDIFSGVLLGVPFGKHVSSMYHDLSAGRGLGQMFIVMDPPRFMGLDTFKTSMSQVLGELGEMPAAEGFDKMCYPDEHTIMGRDRAYATNGMEIVDEIYEYLRSDRVHFDKYDHKNRFAE